MTGECVTSQVRTRRWYEAWDCGRKALGDVFDEVRRMRTGVVSEVRSVLELDRTLQ